MSRQDEVQPIVVAPAPEAPAPQDAAPPGAEPGADAADDEDAPARALPPLPPREATIVLLRTENPKHPGSASHARYDLLRSGMTVAEYLAAAGPRGRRTLRKALWQGHVRVDPAAPPSSESPASAPQQET